MKLLLEKGADVNLKGGYFGNVLQAAVAEDELNVARFLFSRGGKIGPQGQEWKELLSRIRQPQGLHTKEVHRLRNFQRDPRK
jgi:predicted SprT family Zn-dependent metalloprotease